MLSPSARCLLLAASLLLPLSFQTALAAETPVVMASVSEKININHADVALLSEIKGIGSKKAQAIIDHRMEHGSFAHVEELMNVNGIGEMTLQKILPYITL